MKKLTVAILTVTICLSGCTGNIMSEDKEDVETTIENVETTEETVEGTEPETIESEIAKESTTEAIESRTIVTEVITESKEEITHSETVESKEIDEQQWKQAYIKYLTDEWETEEWKKTNTYTPVYYSLIFINDDDIPELYENYYPGGSIYHYNGEQPEKVVLTGWGTEPLYIERGNQFYTSGGRMDGYDSVIYSIHDSQIIELHRGEFGFVGGEGIPIDENGDPYYRYFWDGIEVESKEEYEEEISTYFDKSKAKNVLDNKYTAYEIIEVINSF